MAIDLSARICSSCAHASICPDRETFMSFYDHRDQVMVKCGDGSGDVDTSDEITVRVEHRYLDGPGLEKLYNELGLKGAGYLPCMSSFYGCPLWYKHPFDTPVYSPYPRPAGYIEPICGGARTPGGARIPFVAPCAPPPTNQIYAAPYSSPKLWSCDSCPGKTTFDDFAKLGGTVYSTFAVGELKANAGDTVSIDDIAIPTEMMAGYQRDGSNPASFLIEDESTKIIIYYSYVGTVEDPVDPPDYVIEEEIFNQYQSVTFFIGTAAFYYPPIDNFRTLSGTLKRCTLGTGRRTLDGVVKAPGSTINLKWREDHKDFKPSIDNEEAKSFSLDGVGTFEVWLLEGDTIEFDLAVPDGYDFDRYMTGLYNTDGIIVVHHYYDTESDVNRVRIIFTMGHYSESIPLCFSKSSLVQDPITYPPINYDTFNREWNLIANDLIIPLNWLKESVEEMRPCALRKWPKEKVKETPSYADNAPTDEVASRMQLEIVGYTNEVEKRKTFKPIATIYPASVVALPNEIRFNESGEDAKLCYWALWRMNFESWKIYAKSLATEWDFDPTPESPPILVNPKTENGEDLDEVCDVLYSSITKNYEHAYLKKWEDELNGIGTSSNIRFALYALPDQMYGFYLQNRYGADENDPNFWPTATVKVNENGVTIDHNLEEYRVSDTTAPKLSQKILMVMQPISPAGLTHRAQNFVAVCVDLTIAPIPVTLKLNFDGSKYNPAQSVNIADMKSYELIGVAAEDINDVSLSIDGNIAELTGSKAPFYKITSGECTYTEDIKIHSIYEACKREEESMIQVPLSGFADIDLNTPDGARLSSITINDLDLYEFAKTTVDGHESLGDIFHRLDSDQFQAICTWKDQTMVVSIAKVKIPLTIKATYIPKSNDGVYGCERCKDYVDTSPYDYLEWVPICHNFVESGS